MQFSAFQYFIFNIDVNEYCWAYLLSRCARVRTPTIARTEDEHQNTQLARIMKAPVASSLDFAFQWPKKDYIIQGLYYPSTRTDYDST